MLSGSILRCALISAANNIAVHRKEIDAINFFPVADCDTGTNLYVTLTAARRALEALPESCSASAVLKTAAFTTLRSSRGNSGSIIALMLRGAAKALDGQQSLAASDLRTALSSASEQAYTSVREPVEGTILTLCRECADEAMRSIYKDPLITAESLLSHIAVIARACLKQTSSQIPTLAMMDVVDAGALAFCLMLEGVCSVTDGRGIITDDTPSGTNGTYVFMENNVLNEEIIIPDVAYTMSFSLLSDNRTSGADDLMINLQTCAECITSLKSGPLLHCRLATDHPKAVFDLLMSAGTPVYIRTASHSVTFKVDLSDPSCGEGVPKLPPNSTYLPGTPEYCLEFTLLRDAGSASVSDEMRDYLDNMGSDMILIEGNDLIKVHVHTDTPGMLFALPYHDGYINDWKLENLYIQTTVNFPMKEH